MKWAGPQCIFSTTEIAPIESKRAQNKLKCSNLVEEVHFLWKEIILNEF